MVKTNNVIVQIIYLLTILFFFNSKFIYCQHNQSKSNKLSKVYSSLDSSILNYEKTCRLHDSLFLINKSIKQKKEKYDENKNILKDGIIQNISSLVLNLDNFSDSSLIAEILKNKEIIKKAEALRTIENKLKSTNDSIKLLDEKLATLNISKEIYGNTISNSIIKNNSTGAINLEIRGVRYKVFVADTNLHTIDLHLYDFKDSIHFKNLSNLKRFLDKKYPNKIEMLTNAGMYKGNNDPEGLFICSNRDTFFDVDNGLDNPDLNFYMKPNGIFYCDKKGLPHIIPTEKWQSIDTNNVLCATQSGPLLLNNGKLHPKLNYASSNAKIRSGVGVFKQNELCSKTVFIITSNETNFIDFTEVLKYVIGCNDVLFLDGAISKMYVKTDKISDFENSSFGPIISIIHK